MTLKHRILLVDDETPIHRFLTPALEANDYEVRLATTGADAIRRAANEAPDLVILDLGLPDIDGKDVIDRVRAFSDVPIIVLSARDREIEKIAALDRGADDFVNKPFGIGELMARIRSALRSRKGRAAETEILTAGALTVDLPARRVTRDGDEIKLTPREFDLVVLLARNAGRVMTHRHILATLWGPAHLEDTQYLRVYIGQLRQKIEPNPADPRILLTEPGIGYRMAD